MVIGGPMRLGGEVMLSDEGQRFVGWGRIVAISGEMILVRHSLPEGKDENLDVIAVERGN